MIVGSARLFTQNNVKGSRAVIPVNHVGLQPLRDLQSLRLGTHFTNN